MFDWDAEWADALDSADDYGDDYDDGREYTDVDWYHDERDDCPAKAPCTCAASRNEHAECCCVPAECDCAEVMASDHRLDPIER